MINLQFLYLHFPTCEEELGVERLQDGERVRHRLYEQIRRKLRQQLLESPGRQAAQERGSFPDGGEQIFFGLHTNIFPLPTLELQSEVREDFTIMEPC